MPIAYKVNAALGIVFADWRGTVTAKDIAGYWTELASDQAALACGRSITDISSCDMQFTGEELRLLAKEILEPAIRGRNWKTAVIIKNPVHYGVTRQHEMLSEGFMNTNVFYSDVLARKWVLS
jgi:hypothetical protein